MVGITRTGAYFPRRRLDRALIGKAWGTRVPPGTRTVAGLDEDALTMATDAVLACLGDADPADPGQFDALYFASPSSPYNEKQVASVIATAAAPAREASVAHRGAAPPPARVAKLALAAPDARSAGDAARRAGCEPGQLEPSLVTEAGLLGTAEPLVLLARSLETARPGDFLVTGAYGEGADVLVFRATDRLPAARPRPVAERLARGLPLPSYARYLRAQAVLPGESIGEPVT